MDNKEIVQIKTRELYHLLLVKDVDVVFAHKLFSHIYNVAWYRYNVKSAKTPEAESLARWSLGDARNELDYYLGSWGFCTLDKALIRYVAEHIELNLR